MPSLILIGVIIFTIALFVYSLISHRIEGSMVTAPMIFVAIGLLVSPDGFDIIPLSANSELVLIFAEIASGFPSNSGTSSKKNLFFSFVFYLLYTRFRFLIDPYYGTTITSCNKTHFLNRFRRKY